MKIEDMDIEEDIQDIEGMLDALADMLDDARLSIKATIKAKLKGLGTHSILLKRNQNRLRELLTRYDFDKIKHVPMGTKLGEFIEDRLPIASEVDLIEKILTLSIEDFNLDILDVLTSNNLPKTLSSLISGSELDGVAKNLILANIVEVKDELKDGITAGSKGFVISYMYGKGVKGVVIDNEKHVIYSKTLRFSKTPTLPKLIPISTFGSIKDNFLAHNDGDIKSILALYRKVIKDTGKYLRRFENEDGFSVSEARLLTETVVYHLDFITDSLSKLTSIQYDFLHKCLGELDSLVVSGTVRGTL